MLIKRQAKRKLYDALHRGTVMVCMAITAVSTGYMAYVGYRYFTQIKPQRKLKQLKLIKEGAVEDVDSAKNLST